MSHQRNLAWKELPISNGKVASSRLSAAIAAFPLCYELWWRWWFKWVFLRGVRAFRFKAVCRAQILSEPACSLQLDLHWGNVFASRPRTRVFSVLFSFVNWILSGTWSRHRVIFPKRISEPACSLQVDLHWASPHLPWGIADLFFWNLFMSFEGFCQPACFFCCSIYIETAQNSGEECNKFADLLFFRLLLCLSTQAAQAQCVSLIINTCSFILRNLKWPWIWRICMGIQVKDSSR